ncbi:MAG: hypothetical protein KOO63_05655 [Bacteroidales bacterium]|nr:hypothetical protein [Candidatus Latescibacterota bacterium]
MSDKGSEIFKPEDIKDDNWTKDSFVEITRGDCLKGDVVGKNERIRFTNGLNIPLPVSEMLLIPIDKGVSKSYVDMVYALALEILAKRWMATREAIRIGGDGDAIFSDMLNTRKRSELMVCYAIEEFLSPGKHPNINSLL